MVMPLVGAAARTGAKKLAKQATKKKPMETDELVRNAAMGALGTSSAAGSTLMALNQEDRSKAAEERKEQESRESAAEMKRETRGMKKGGVVSSASKRADGIAQRGKTKGRMV